MISACDLRGADCWVSGSHPGCRSGCSLCRPGRWLDSVLDAVVSAGARVGSGQHRRAALGGPAWRVGSGCLTPRLPCAAVVMSGSCSRRTGTACTRQPRRSRGGVQGWCDIWRGECADRGVCQGMLSRMVLRLSSCATSFRICRVIIGVMSFMSPAGVKGEPGPGCCGRGFLSARRRRGGALVRR